MASKPIVARLSDGREYGFETPAKARKVDPDAVILRYQDGTSYDEPKPVKKDEKA